MGLNSQKFSGSQVQKMSAVAQEVVENNGKVNNLGEREEEMSNSSSISSLTARDEMMAGQQQV